MSISGFDVGGARRFRVVAKRVPAGVSRYCS
jgi:hypothetical protein